MLNCTRRWVSRAETLQELYSTDASRCSLYSRNRFPLVRLRGSRSHARTQGRTQGGEGPGPPLGPEKYYIFRGFPLITWFASLKSVFWRFLLCGRTEEACSMVNSLRKVDFSHPTGHYRYMEKNPPLEKILGAPLLVRLCRASLRTDSSRVHRPRLSHVEVRPKTNDTSNIQVFNSEHLAITFQRPLTLGRMELPTNTHNHLI